MRAREELLKAKALHPFKRAHILNERIWVYYANATLVAGTHLDIYFIALRTFVLVS